MGFVSQGRTKCATSSERPTFSIQRSFRAHTVKSNLVIIGLRAYIQVQVIIKTHIQDSPRHTPHNSKRTPKCLMTKAMSISGGSLSTASGRSGSISGSVTPLT